MPRPTTAMVLGALGLLSCGRFGYEVAVDPARDAGARDVSSAPADGPEVAPEDAQAMLDAQGLNDGPGGVDVAWPSDAAPDLPPEDASAPGDLPPEDASAPGDLPPEDAGSDAVLRPDGPPSSDISALAPIFVCTGEYEPGRYASLFGTRNNLDRDILAPPGASNYFDPAPADRGQPDLYPPGVHLGIVVATHDTPTIVWSLANRTSTGSITAASCPVETSAEGSFLRRNDGVLFAIPGTAL